MRRDLLLLISARVLRAFGFGFAGVLLAINLQNRRFTPTEIGALLSVSLLAAALSGLLAASATSRWGRRKTLAAIGLLMAFSGIDLALATEYWLLFCAGLTGMVGVAGTDFGPFLPVEQAVLAEVAASTDRNRAFGRYSLTGAVAGAIGAVAAGGATDASRIQVYFVLFAILGLVTAVIPMCLSPGVEGEQEAPVFGSIRPLIGLSGLFLIDSLGGGLVVNSVVVYWLHLKFGATAAVLGPSFGAMSVLTALSYEAAGRLADRIGLVNTMVFTHLPSNFLLILVPFAPGLSWALGILLIRSAIVSMDQPARQAYVVSIVKSNERSGAIALTGAVRGIGAAFGPLVTGAAIQAAALSLPFFAGGVLKSIYDVGLYMGFRSRAADHELTAKP